MFCNCKGSYSFWGKNAIHDIINTCIILHNLIIEDERDIGAPIGVKSEAPLPKLEIAEYEISRSQKFLVQYRKSIGKSKTNKLISHFKMC